MRGLVVKVELYGKKKWKCVPEVEEIVDTLRRSEKDVNRNGQGM